MAQGASSNSLAQPVYITNASGVDTDTLTANIVYPVLPAGSGLSGSITTGGVAQTVATANANRRGLTFQNTSDTEMRVTESGAAATATTGYLVAAGGGMFRASTNRAISVFCATTGKTFAGTEW